MEKQQQQTGLHNIVIVGGGIIGCTTAYYLTRHPKFDVRLHTITLLEASSIAAGASGKAGGLLARWAYPSCLVPLSFSLHSQLAEEHNGAQRWGYRKLGCGNVTALVDHAHLDRAEQLRARRPQQALPPDPTLSLAHAASDKVEDWDGLPKKGSAAASLLAESPLPSDLDWIDGSVAQHYEQIGLPGTPLAETAQVHPFHFTTSIAALAQEKGVDIRLGARATRIATTNPPSDSPSPSSLRPLHRVEYEDGDDPKTLQAILNVTDVIVTAGPWTGKLLPKSKIESVRAHSVILNADVSPYAIFTKIILPSDYVPEHQTKQGRKRRHRGPVDPEIYARPFGEVYACGEVDTNVPLPTTATEVQCDEARCDDLIAYVSTISPILATAPIKTRQACYLPSHKRFGEERGPLIGPTIVPGLWVASGHSCWGIQNGPATGYLMAEMLLDGEATSADISKLDPRKFSV